MQPVSYNVGIEDPQTYMARFESMRNSVQGKRNRKVFVVHKELERQFRNALRSEEFTSRMNDAELKRQRDRLEERLERIRSEQTRCKDETAKRHAELESELRAHEERRRSIEQEDMATQKTKAEGKVAAEEVLERIGRMAMPNSVKQRLQMHFMSSSFSSLYSTSEAPATAEVRPTVDDAVIEEEPEIPSL